MQITWEVEDGYIGKSRPQFTEIDDDDLSECSTDEEREEFIEQCVQEDFMSNISWSETRRD